MRRREFIALPGGVRRREAKNVFLQAASSKMVF
jgi:hypothetical protein